MNAEELLIAFLSRRSLAAENPKFEVKERLSNLEWAVQSLLEQMRETQSPVQAAKPPPQPPPTTEKAAFQ